MADQENDIIDMDDESLEEEVGGTIFLTDEDDNEIEVELLAIIETDDGKKYVVLLPVDDDDNEVIIMEVVEVEDDEALEAYIPVEDEEVLNDVFEIFRAEFEDVIEFED